MTQWHSKEFSKLTGVSVRTLHYYDHIDLLKPSARSANGYRWYLARDLVRLQQIIALKFFGFNLSQIKAMLHEEPVILEHLLTQQQMLQEQVMQLQLAEDAMNAAITQLTTTGSLEWQNLVFLIERYTMTDDVKKSWYGKNLSAQQLAEYLELKQQYPEVFTAQSKAIEEINSLQLGDPEGPDGERIVKIFANIARQIEDAMDKFRHFNAEILRDLKAGTITSTPLSPEGGVWISRAMLAHNLKRWGTLYQEIKQNLNQDPAGKIGKKIAASWCSLIDEQFIGTPPALGIGIMMWQEYARQKSELLTQPAPLPPQEMSKKIHCEIVFDPASLGWIEAALKSHGISSKK